MGRTAVIIPARYESKRLQGKVLLRIAGKPMIEHVYKRACKACVASDVIVAADDMRIKEAVEGFGGIAVMTSSEHKSGTDRIAEVVESLKDVEIVVNVQGDEPLIDPSVIDLVAHPLIRDRNIVMGTAAYKIRSLEELLSTNLIKVVVDREGFALYFSRAPIPFIRDIEDRPHVMDEYCFLGHIGIYSYRRRFLLEFARMEPAPLEEIERLEQLRALENGYKIYVSRTEFRSVGVDTMEDLERVRRKMSRCDTS